MAVHTGDIRNFDDKQAVVVDNYADSPFRGRVYVGWDTVIVNAAGTAVASSRAHGLVRGRRRLVLAGGGPGEGPG